MVSPSRCSPVWRAGRLYAIATPACTSGICTTEPFALAMSESVMYASESPKSTVPACSCFTPPPEPMDWYATCTPLLVAYEEVQTDIIGATNVDPAQLRLVACP